MDSYKQTLPGVSMEEGKSVNIINVIDSSKLVIGKIIARGAFGIVHKATYCGQPVAVKLLDVGDKGFTEDKLKSITLDFFEEVQVWKDLNHPNITKMIGVTRSMAMCKRKCKISKSESECCMVAEYVNGGTLRSYLIKNQNKKLPLKTVMQLAIDIAKGLSYLHSKNIIHRDVKPENMLLNKQHIIKLADFGISIFKPSHSFYVIRGEAGTRGYMAPEVFSGKSYTHKCDIYSFGICLWEIYCCERVYSNFNTLYDITPETYEHMRPTIPVTCPRSIARLIEQCWSADPEKRPEMEDVILKLQEIIEYEGCQMHLQKSRPFHGCFFSS